MTPVWYVSNAGYGQWAHTRSIDANRNIFDKLIDSIRTHSPARPLKRLAQFPAPRCLLVLSFLILGFLSLSLCVCLCVCVGRIQGCLGLCGACWRTRIPCCSSPAPAPAPPRCGALCLCLFVYNSCRSTRCHSRAVALHERLSLLLPDAALTHKKCR